MRIETPQILWHADENGKNAPVLSLSVRRANDDDDDGGDEDDVPLFLATAGSVPEIHLWRTSSVSAFRPEHACALARHHQRSVNALAFSPDGRTLLAGGDGGEIRAYEPSAKTKRWSSVRDESDLVCRFVARAGAPTEDVMDLCWEPRPTSSRGGTNKEPRRFVVGCLDHEVCVYEESPRDGELRRVWRRADHASYVQGVAWDPLGVYLASQGSDRTLRVYSRDARAAPRFAVDRSRAIKWFETRESSRKHNLFADESAAESFFRRPTWTPDGAFLVAPTALHRRSRADGDGDATITRFATCLFARHRFDRPAAVLLAGDGDRPSVVARASPVRYRLPEPRDDDDDDDDHADALGTGLPHRSVVAVLTSDAVCVYDTHHLGRPLAAARGLHYAGLTDCEWTPDGRRLLVTSSDGYVSALTFEDGELGEVLEEEKESEETMETVEEETVEKTEKLVTENKETVSTPVIATTTTTNEPTVVTTLVARKKKRPVVEMTNTSVEVPAATNKVVADDEPKETKNDDDAIAAPVEKKSKKKRIQPILLPSN